MGLEQRIKELGERVKHNQTFLNQENDARKARTAKEREWTEAQDGIRMPFWCSPCARDFHAKGYKRLHNDGMATYRGECPKGHIAVRYITKKWLDPYWEQSRNVQIDREKHADDMLTPDNPRFKKIYPAQWKALTERQSERPNTEVQS